MDGQQILLPLGKLIFAALVGGAIGVEREMHGQAAGVRTNILVAVGSCLLMMLSLHIQELHSHLSDSSVVRLDPARIASYAIASMGFLGAGAIIIGKGSVRGLTTASGLWIVTALGLAIGSGYFIPVVIATGISLVTLYGLRRMKAIFNRDEHSILSLKYHSSEKPLELIKEILARHNIAIQFINLEMEPMNHRATYRLRLVCKENLPWGEVLKSLLETRGLEKIDWLEGEVP
jgi:putative Mg2+ transporter-C (MgtC) family protein